MAAPHQETVYGINPVFETILAERRRIQVAYLCKSSTKNPRIRRLEKLIESRDIRIEWVEKGRLIHVADSRDHQGAALKTGPYPYVYASDLMDRSRLILIDNIEDPHNVGAIMRTAEVLGFDGVMLPRKGVPSVLPSVVKASAGASEFLSIAKNRSANQYVKEALDNGYTVAALDRSGSDRLEDLRADPPEKLLLVVGGEDKGIGQFILNSAHHVISIPQTGRVSSLNASVAAGIALFALRPKARP